MVVVYVYVCVFVVVVVIFVIFLKANNDHVRLGGTDLDFLKQQKHLVSETLSL